MDVSIIIVNFNTKELLKGCVSSIYQFTTGINFEIIVVDNASIDGSKEMIKVNFPEVVLIESKENLGFGKANNLGAKYAKGKYLFLLNSDTVLIENSIIFLKNCLDGLGEKTAVVGCRLLNGDKKADVSYGNFPSLFQELFEYGLSKIFRNYFLTKLSPAVIGNGNEVKKVNYIRGAAMLFRKNIFDKFNGFDEDFFLYYEETELCFRLVRSGYQIIWNPNTSIIHYVGASGENSKKINYWIFEQFYRSKFLYYKKCHGEVIAYFVLIVSIPKILIKNKEHNLRKVIKILTGSAKTSDYRKL